MGTNNNCKYCGFKKIKLENPSAIDLKNALPDDPEYKVLLSNNKNVYLHFSIDEKVINLEYGEYRNKYGVRGGGSCSTCSNCDKKTGACNCDPTDCLNYKEIEKTVDRLCKITGCSSAEAVMNNPILVAKEKINQDAIEKMVERVESIDSFNKDNLNQAIQTTEKILDEKSNLSQKAFKRNLILLIVNLAINIITILLLILL